MVLAWTPKSTWSGGRPIPLNTAKQPLLYVLVGSRYSSLGECRVHASCSPYLDLTRA